MAEELSLKERIGKGRESIEPTSLKERLAAGRMEVSDLEDTRTVQPLKTIGETFRIPDIQRSFQHGMFFGFSDEIEAAGKALWDRLEGEDFGDAYLRNRDKFRAMREGFQEEHPVANFTAEVIGAIGMGGAATGPVKGASMFSRIVRGAGVGGATGAAFGAGQAEELEDVPTAMLRGGFTGGLVGGAVPPVFAAAGAAASGLRSAFRPSSGANSRIALALQRDQMTPEQIVGALDEAKSLGRSVTVADVGGTALKRELETAVQRPGPAGNIAEDLIANRNKEQLSILSKDLVKGTGVNADAVEDVITKTMTLRSKAAKPVYDQAMNFSAELNDDIVSSWNSAVKTPLGKQALGKARKILNVENFDEAPLMERVDAFKKGLDDIIGGAKRKGENQIAGKALELKKDIVGKVDSVNPAYAKARKTWENESDYIEAINRGRDVLKPSFTSAQLKKEFVEMTDAEQEAMRIGVVDAVITRMRQQSAKEPNLVRIIRSPEIRDKLKAVMKPDMASKLDKILDIEDSKFALGAQVTKGSQTAQRTASQVEQEKQINALKGLDFILELVISPLRTVFTRAIPAIPRMTRDSMLARQNEQITRRLLSSEADEIFKIPSLQPRNLDRLLIPPAVIATDEK